MEHEMPADAITSKPPTPLAGGAAPTRTSVHAGHPPGGSGIHAGLPAGKQNDAAGSPSSSRSGRETAVGFVLFAVLAGMVAFFLYFVSFGIFAYVFAAALGITAVGFFHYVLWGYGLSEEVAEEMHRERLKRQQELDERL